MASIFAFIGEGMFRKIFKRQPKNEVVVRSPDKHAQISTEPAEGSARRQWEYAVMCSAAYEKARLSVGDDQRGGEARKRATNPKLPGWARWADFPSDKLLESLSSIGLYVDVWEREEHPRVIAVIFEGTNFTSLPDWRANLRWILRFLPSFEDQYTVAADDVAREFYERLATDTTRYEIHVGSPDLSSTDGDAIKIITSGHSLGGGLAQHFAYAFPQPYASGGPKISEVFAFDSSPVTGWSVVSRGTRSYNSRDLRIHRVFERGEILSFVRVVTSRLSSYSEHPAIWEYRYNFDSSWSVFKNHSIRLLAEGLGKAAGFGK